MTVIDEHVELLITRYVDGEITADDWRTLEAELARNPAARRLVDEYQRLDAQSREALRHVCISPGTAVVATRTRRGVWLGSAAGLLAAAAVLALVLRPFGSSRSPLDPDTNNAGVGQVADGWHSFVDEPSLNRAPAWADRAVPVAHFVDYVDEVPVQPVRLKRRSTRDYISVMDEQTRSVYLLEVDNRAQKVVPVSGNF